LRFEMSRLLIRPPFSAEHSPSKAGAGAPGSVTAAFLLISCGVENLRQQVFGSGGGLGWRSWLSDSARRGQIGHGPSGARSGGAGTTAAGSISSQAGSLASQPGMVAARAAGLPVPPPNGPGERQPRLDPASAPPAAGEAEGPHQAAQQCSEDTPWRRSSCYQQEPRCAHALALQQQSSCSVRCREPQRPGPYWVGEPEPWSSQGEQARPKPVDIDCCHNDHRD